ncbi:hypothetical protein D3C76_1546140 [compost metagenome]
MNADKSIRTRRMADLHPAGKRRLLACCSPCHLDRCSLGRKVIPHVKGCLQGQILLHCVISGAKHAGIVAAMSRIDNDQLAADLACSLGA